MNMPESMMRNRTFKLALVLGAATMLQGCVAAIPLAAGGLLTGTNVVSSDREPVTPPPPAVAAAPAEVDASVQVGAREPELDADQPIQTNVAEFAAGEAPLQEGLASGNLAELDAPEQAGVPPKSEPAPSSNLAVADEADIASGNETVIDAVTPEVATAEIVTKPAQEASPITPAPVSVSSDAGFADAYRDSGGADDSDSLSSAQAAAALASTRAQPSQSATPPARLAAPSVPEPPISATTRTVMPQLDQPAPNAVTQLLSYANQRQFTSGENRMSAMLADRISLEPKRAECGGIRPAILIDLDPQGGIFSPAQATNPPAGLGAGLSQLRTQGVHIAWISKNPETLSNQIRRALTRTGLDIYGRDTVLLVSKDDDRKQTLREDFAKANCVIAIAGDARSDFDELYDYLLDPNEASSLEPLFGEGWFLIPQPLVTEGS